jgi:imidazolonepropionase-like amidohydrolase
LLAAGVAAPFVAACGGPSEESDVAGAGPGGDLIVENAHVFDGERFRGVRNVIVRGGHIVDVGADAAADLPRFDAGGRILLPGLIDAHTHDSRQAAEGALRFGVTGMLDMHGQVDRRAADRRSSLASRMRADTWWAGWGVTVPEGHPTQMTPSAPVVDESTSVEQLVADQVEAGADYLKLFIAGSGEVPTLDLDQASRAVAAAHDHDRKAVAHVSTGEDLLLAARAGVDVLAHAPSWGAPVSEEGLTLLVEQEIPVVATLLVLSSTACEFDPTSYLEDPAVAERLVRHQRWEIEGASPRDCSGADMAAWEDYSADTMRRMREAGVRLLVGTDIGNHPAVTGVSMYHEMELLRGHGVGLEDVLAGATAWTADTFDLPDRGRISPGMRGDLVLMEATEPEHVLDSYAPAAVWKNGHPVALSP